MKPCRTCGVRKPFDAFCIDRSRKDGLCGRCKECDRDYRIANADAIKARRIAYYTANADTIIARSKERQKAYYVTNRDTIKIRHKAYRLKRKYGLTLEDYNQMAVEQLWRCANPGCPNGASVDQCLCVDHDHACCPGEASCGNCVRGLLCFGCNSALGYVNDEIGRLRGLVEYLDTHAGLKLVS